MNINEILLMRKTEKTKIISNMFENIVITHT